MIIVLSGILVIEYSSEYLDESRSEVFEAMRVRDELGIEHVESCEDHGRF